MTRRIWIAAALLAVFSASCGEGPTEPTRELTPNAPALNQNQFASVTLNFAGGTSITAGQSFTNVQITVSAANALPTGTYTLYLTTGSFAVPVASGALASHINNIQTVVLSIPWNTATQMIGTNNYQVQYNGDGTFFPALSNLVSATVTKAVPAIALSYANATPAWQNFAITANVTLPVAPQASPQLYDGTTFLGNMGFAGQNGNVYAFAFNVPASSMAPNRQHQFLIVLNSDAGQVGGQTGFNLLTVTRPTPTIQFTANSSVVVGQTLTFTANLQGPTAATVSPTGPMQFRSQTGQTFVANLQSTGAHSATATFSLPTSAQMVGTTAYTAIYQGDGNYFNVQSTPVNVTVTPATSSLALSGPSSFAYGATNTKLTATLTTPVLPQFGNPLSLYDGSQQIPYANLTSTPVSGGLQWTVTLLPSQLLPGQHTLKVVYPGEQSISPSTSNTITVTVLPASVTPTISFTNTGGNTISNTGSFTFAVAVPSTIAGPSPSGTVDIWMGGVGTGTKVLSGLPVLLTGGGPSATGTLAGNAFAGMTPSNTYTAVYSGDSRFASANSASITGNVSLASTSTALSVPASVNAFAGGANLVATLTSPVAPTGTMTFKDGNTVLGTVSVPSSQGAGVYQFTYTTTAQQLLPSGVHTITASYANDAAVLPSASSPQSITVNAIPSAATIAFNGSSTILTTGSFNFDITVSGAGGGPTPTGTVSVWLGGAGSGIKVAGPMALAPAGANATATASLAGNAYAQMAPSNTYSVVYSGNANYLSSTSGAITGIVNTPADVTPPLVTPIVTGTLGLNGWYTSNVSLRWNIGDPESRITAQSECRADVASDMQHTFTCSATSQGGTTLGQFLLKRDATPPVISVTNLKPSYGADERVAPKCSATDALSGLVSLTGCVDDNGYRFAIGTNTFALTATDNAGNAITRSYTFDVVLTKQILCTITTRWVSAMEASSLCGMLNADQFAQYRSALATSAATAPHIVTLQQLVDVLIGGLSP